MNRTVSAEESTVTRESDSPPKKKNSGELRTKSLNNDQPSPTSAQEAYECAICLSWMKDPVLTKCGHKFCGTCLEEWRK